MEQLISQLEAVLTQEADRYQALIKVLAEESDRLVANDTEGLMKVTRRKDTIALQIRSLEESRLLLVDKFARALDCDAETLTITELCEYAGEARKSGLIETRDRLKDLVRRAASFNDRNRRLVENSLRLLHGTMETIQKQLRSHMRPKKGYGPPAPNAKANLGGMVVNQQV